MNRSRLYAVVAAIYFLAPGLLPADSSGPKTDEAKDSTAEKLFDADPAHPWNRLHQFLHTRTGVEEVPFTFHGPASRLGRHRTFLLEGDSHDKAIRLLDAFLKAKEDERIKESVKRALLQRDLWYVFDKLGDVPYFGSHQPFVAENQPQQRAIQKRLAQLMRRLEQPAARLKTLPDTYHLTVERGTFPTKFDAEHPDRAYLPADLRLDDKSAWVIVRAASTGLSAPAHHRFEEGKSVFLTLLRLPGPRKKTEAYLADMPVDREKGFQPLPDGSQVALVRRMLLPDDKGELRPTPIIEDVQLRVFSKRREQHAFEFVLDRAGLRSGRVGLSLRAFDQPARECLACHKADAGVFSLSTFGLGMKQGYQGVARSNLTEQVDGTVKLKKQSYSWGLLQGLRETTPP